MGEREFTINVKMNERWINQFCSFLKRMEYNGNIGHSEMVHFCSDGDGDFRPKFDINTDFTEVEPIDVIDRRVVGHFKVYDAG